MRFIKIADIHLSLYGQDPYIEGLPERLYNLNQVLRRVANYALENEISKIVIGGDVFHTKSIIHSVAQSVLLDYINEYTRKGLEFIIIDGNHDMSSKSGDGVSALKCLDSISGVDMIHTPKVIENILFVPWNAKTMEETIKRGDQDYLISHFGLNEAELNSGISIVSDLGLDDLRRFRHCYLGHYHKGQTVGNVTYVGSIMQMDWGEKGEDKRFLVIDTSAGTHHSILTSGYKKHYELEINTENKEIIIAEARKLKEDGHHVKINKVEAAVDLTEIKDEFRVVDKTIRNITNRGISTTMSADDKLKRYLTIKEIPIELTEQYLTVAKTIMDECSGVTVETKAEEQNVR